MSTHELPQQEPPLATADLDPAAIMDRHYGAHPCVGGVYVSVRGRSCEPYRLAVAVIRRELLLVKYAGDTWRHDLEDEDSWCD